MYAFKSVFTHLFTVFSYLIHWTLLVIPIASVVGSLVALFLWLLETVTQIRFGMPWLVFSLPLAGIAIWAMYNCWGKDSEAGNNLIMDEIHEPGGGIPWRMAPLVLVGTIVTHLFGGSAGREGTAVQMGGSVAGFFSKRFGLSKEDTRILLMAGIAAGFASVFGTPVTGTIFALEVLSLGMIRHGALLPCFIAAVLADVITSAWGIRHTQYTIGFAAGMPGHIDWLLLAEVIGVGAFSGLAAMLFGWTTDGVRTVGRRWVRIKWLLPVIGGVVIILLSLPAGMEDYLGLGVTGKHEGAVTIVSCFRAGGAGYLSWWWKLLFTAITLGTGFKGGEVTPLFFIGAALGNTLATLCGAPVDLMAGLGFIAVFAGATNTPVACTLMGVELFGTDHVLYYAVACFTAYCFSGDKGIYRAQRIGAPKIV